MSSLTPAKSTSDEYKRQAPPSYDLAPAVSNLSIADNSSYEDRLKREDALIKKFGISERNRCHLDTFASFHTVAVCDDSYSMTTRLSMRKPSRWETQRDVMGEIANMCTIYDENGIDVYFLNRGSVSQVHNPKLLAPLFAQVPDIHALTPLPDKLVELDQMYKASEKNVLTIVSTDGHPTGEGTTIEEALKNGHDQLVAFMDEREKNKDLCAKRPISFVMVTNEKDVVKYYDDFTKKYSNVTITEDFEKEKTEMNEEFENLSFSRGDWLLKITLGAFVKEIGDMDQNPPDKIQDTRTKA